MEYLWLHLTCKNLSEISGVHLGKPILMKLGVWLNLFCLSKVLWIFHVEFMLRYWVPHSVSGAYKSSLNPMSFWNWLLCLECTLYVCFGKCYSLYRQRFCGMMRFKEIRSCFYPINLKDYFLYFTKLMSGFWENAISLPNDKIFWMPAFSESHLNNIIPSVFSSSLAV